MTASGTLYEIGSGAQRVTIAGVAATLLSWRVDGTELLLTHAADEVGDSYQGKTILPWPNRVAAGRYTFDGAEYQLAITEPARGAALHGLMNWVEWEPVEHTGTRVRLRYVLHPQYGFPFLLHFQLTYTATPDGVSCTLEATNAGTRPAPFGAAYHPYLRLAERADDVVLDLPAASYYRTGEDLIPLGKEPVDGGLFDFRGGREVSGAVLDTAFTDLAVDADGTARVHLGAPAGRTVELWADHTHRYLQVYTDDAPGSGRPARAGITVEPMTCAPNALNTGDGLRVLAPGESHVEHWGMRSPAA
ncbi:aldose 1-epimerase family protein [Qaidamihabitans albus]|uniref:aldose 1-epimerase family protein n=1 Tax=Qaidamihabitans albus TaxID=2795733 RepID=UPI0018F273C9|nr:aldose 1-epimerase family protein [Qaidamihabitans albus]